MNGIVTAFLKLGAVALLLVSRLSTIQIMLAGTVLGMLRTRLLGLPGAALARKVAGA